MSDYLTGNNIWLLGAGNMGIEYARVLKEMKIAFTVIGRGQSSADSFKKATDIDVITNGLEDFLRISHSLPTAAIVAVSADQLASETIRLIEYGVKKILVEKPAGLNIDEIKKLVASAKQNGAQVFVAYNRRFYASVIKCIELIKEDGGVTSFNFEFTEWGHLIEPLNKSAHIKEEWMIANSTHVIDLAFFIGGMPKILSTYSAGSLKWHSKAAVFAGSGISKGGALFSYQANWDAPGRWSVEMLTNKHRFILRPLEQLQVQNKGSVVIENIPLDDTLDKKFKPGLYLQLHNFLFDEEHTSLLNIFEHGAIFEDVYEKLLNHSVKLQED